MSTLVKIHRKGQMTLPTKLRAAIGVAEGDIVEATVQRGKIVLTPKLIVDRSSFPTADEDYTPAQKRAIDARLAKSESEVKSGRGYGPFNTADEMIASLKAQLKKKGQAKKPKRSR